MATIYNLFRRGDLWLRLMDGRLFIMSAYIIGKKVFIPEDLPIDEDYLVAELNEEQKQFWKSTVVIGNPYPTVAGYNCQN